MRANKLERILDLLESYYGKPEALRTTDPFELILRENVVYLADDIKRDRVFEELRRRIGLDPEKILDAPRETLLEITSLAGILPETQVEKLIDIARITKQKFGGSLKSAVQLPLKQALRALKAFPGIGEPGAEKILLFSRSQPVFALESNGLRVLLRIGFGEEKKSYSGSYRSAQEAVKPHLKPDFDWRIRAHQLLRRHGQALCKRTRPRCPECPVRSLCLYFTTKARRD